MTAFEATLGAVGFVAMLTAFGWIAVGIFSNRAAARQD